MSERRQDTAAEGGKRTLPELAAGIGQGSEVVAASAAVRKRPDNILGLLVRDLTHQEIALMEDRGCRADDWSLIQVAEDFDPFRVRRSHFKGRCVLGRFVAELEVVDGLSLPAGIYDCTLIDCQIGNDCLLENVRFAAHVVCEREAVLFDVGSITCSGQALFGCGQELPLAVETGGREVPVWAEIDVPAAADIARDRADRHGQAAILTAIDRYMDAVRSPVAWVRRGANVRHVERIFDAYIGPGAIINHALSLVDVTVLSSRDERTEVSGGATVEHAILQWGAKVSGNAVVRNSVLLEHSAVDEHGIVAESLIGPNTIIAKGEVTASLVGPFVGFHHQSLLIAALWPEGKGNVAYGAMVGSNHTGRAPDQEIWPGEGTFFGLGCSIKFPSDFTAAPYSVVSSGVATLAQRMRFPFSLISTPQEAIDDSVVPRAFNEIHPAWVLYSNAYGIERSEAKYAKRDRSRRHEIHYQILRPGIMRMVRDALHRLEAVTEQRELYLEQHVPGLGKNVLREQARLDAIEAYRRVLLRYSLRIFLGEIEGTITIAGSVEVAHELLDEVMPNTDQATRLRTLIEVERNNAEIVESSKRADDRRGERIIPGYADAHLLAEDDPVVARAWERVRSTERRVAALG
ncbi:MAG: DUF4954 family protein [Planctomycetota bacterium]|jgi:hypothetical protein|nr:DUF4954 family protein [Planctomycetota bacterium]